MTIRHLLIVAIIIAQTSANTIAQTVEDWQFNSGTVLTDTTNSGPGTASWVDGDPTSYDPPVSGGSLVISSSGADRDGLWYADISDISTGIYQLDINDVTVSGLSGGLDDYFSFGITDNNGSNNARSFSVTGSNSRDKAVLVIGNENNSGGLDAFGFSHGTTTSSTDIFSDYTGTYDFRILWDADNETVDFSFQRNGGGYSAIGSQVSYSDSDAGGLLLINFDVNNSGGADTFVVGSMTFSQVPEPSTAWLLALSSAALVVFRKRLH